MKKIIKIRKLGPTELTWEEKHASKYPPLKKVEKKANSS